jgi:hypothetical protein
MNYITPEIKAYIGLESEEVEAWDPVELGSIRRMSQAIMDNDPVYWNEEYAKSLGFEGIVAPPLYPMHAIRRLPGTPDPLVSDEGNPDYDGAGQSHGTGLGLPPIPIPLSKLINGGNEVEVYAYARPNERIVAKSKYKNVYQKEGSSGPLVFVITETSYRAKETNTLLMISRRTQIFR